MIYLLIEGIIFIWILVVIILLLEFKIYPRKITKNQLEQFSVLMNAKDQYTQLHSEHVAALSELIYDQLPRNLKKCINKKKLLKAAILHDIGKIYVPDDILNKADKLTDEEYDIMKLHTQIGAKILERTSFKNIAPIVALHHERIDGHGYVGIKSSEIPIESRLISVSDTYCALTTDRVYRKSKTINEALKIIKEAAGTQLDELLVNCFLEIDIESLVAVDTMLKEQHFVGGGKSFK